VSSSRPDGRTAAAIAVTLLFWGSSFAAVKAGLESFGPGEVALGRFLVASLALAIYALLGGLRVPALRDVPALVLIGFLGVTVYHLGINFGQVSVSAGAASIIVSTNPIFTALLATFFLKERLRVWGWIGVVIAFSGSALVALGEGRGMGFNPYALPIVVAAIATAISFVIQKPYLRRYKAIEMTTYTIWAGTAFMLVFMPGLARQLPQASTESVLSVVYLGLFPAAVAYITWTYALARTPASVLSTYLYVIPVLGIFFAWLWRGEVPVLLSIAGGVLALAGVALVNTLGRDKPAVVPPDSVRGMPANGTAASPSMGPVAAGLAEAAETSGPRSGREGVPGD